MTFTTSTEHLTTAQVSRLLGIHPQTLRRWAADGRIQARRFGRDYRFERSEIERFVAMHTPSSQPA